MEESALQSAGLGAEDPALLPERRRVNSLWFGCEESL